MTRYIQVLAMKCRYLSIIDVSWKKSLSLISNISHNIHFYFKIHLNLEITNEHLTSTRQIMTSSQKNYEDIFPISGTNQQWNILDFMTSQTRTCHWQTKPLRDKIQRTSETHNDSQDWFTRSLKEKCLANLRNVKCLRITQIVETQKKSNVLSMNFNNYS